MPDIYTNKFANVGDFIGLGGIDDNSLYKVISMDKNGELTLKAACHNKIIKMCQDEDYHLLHIVSEYDTIFCGPRESSPYVLKNKITKQTWEEFNKTK